MGRVARRPSLSAGAVTTSPNARFSLTPRRRGEEGIESLKTGSMPPKSLGMSIKRSPRFRKTDTTDTTDAASVEVDTATNDAEATLLAEAAGYGPVSAEERHAIASRRRLGHDVLSSSAANQVTAVLMIDIDQYEVVKGRFGDEAAETLVSEIGERLSGNIRSGDVIYRQGDKDYCILLPGATVAQGHLVAARLISVVHKHNLPDGSHATVSIGIAGTENGQVNQAISGADRAMADAKRAGCDRAATFTAH